jgi:hypothetical protein
MSQNDNIEEQKNIPDRETTSTHKRILPYSCTDQVDAIEWRGKKFSREALRHIQYFPGDDGGMFNPNSVQWAVTNNVAEATSNEEVPCEPKFIEALFFDFVSYSLAASKFISAASGSRSLDSPLEGFERLVHENLSIIMQHCRRLREHPRLFPSESLKNAFLYKIKKVNDSFHSLVEIATGYDELLQSVCQPITNMEQTISNEVNGTTSSWPKLSDSLGNVSPKIPEFLPDRAGNRKGPWSNWLENSAAPQDGWIAIQQKIPRVGDKLMRQICLLYDAVSEEFSQNEFIGQNEDKVESTDTISSPGYGFTHFTWSGFCTIPVYELGFQNGKRKYYDRNGKLTIEHLSRCLCKLDGKGDGVQQQSSNCPYFRFAVAYKP